MTPSSKTAEAVEERLKKKKIHRGEPLEVSGAGHPTSSWQSAQD